MPLKGTYTNMAFQTFKNLSKTFFPNISHRPDSWRGFLYIYFLHFPDSGLSVLTGLHSVLFLTA